MSPNQFGYGCIVDAGSSGSRIYLYRWPKEEYDDDIPKPLSKVEQEAIFSDERNVGISDDRGVDLLGELLSSTKAAIPSNVDPSDVPIYLGATAGMRLLNSELEADAIMTRVRSKLRMSGFLFLDDWARTISGDEESVYGWLVANYLRNDGNFPDDSVTYGSLDLGGASTQISLLSTALGEEEDQPFPLRIGSLQYPLYTQSYLHYGADQGRILFDAKLISPSDKVNPCYPVGYTSPDTGVSGSSDWDECLNNVAKLFDEQHSNLRGGGEDSFAIAPPPIGNDAQEQQRYIAMSVFVFVWDFIGLNIGTETDDLDTLKDKAGGICSMSHSEQTTHYDLQMKDRPPGRKTNKPFAQCFNAAFSYHLLGKGYGLPVTKTPIEIYYEINGGKVQWALGMMLVEANRLDLINKEHGEIDRKMYSGTDNATRSYIFMGLIILALILGTIIRSRRLREKGKAYPSSCIDPNVPRPNIWRKNQHRW